MENKLQASSTISFSTQAEADLNIEKLSDETAGDAIALMASPLMENLDLTVYFKTGRILCLCVSGDPEPSGSTLDFSWVLNLRHQCIEYDIPFYFTGTGGNFLFKGRTFHIEKRFQASQARKAEVHYFPVKLAFNPPTYTNDDHSGESDISAESIDNNPFSNDSFTVSHLNFPIEQEDFSVPEFENRTAPHETITIPGINYEVEVEKSNISEYCKRLFYRLENSKFRSGFHLHKAEAEYYYSHGEDTIRIHAADFIRERLAPKEPANDGKQTPMKGHPVFIAQHATACCCRGCLSKWHHIPEHRALTEDEQSKIVYILMEWIKRDLKKH